MAVALWLGLSVSAAIAADGGRLQPLSAREFNRPALAAEEALRIATPEVRRVDFHRAQGFRWRSPSRVPVTVVSLLVQRDGRPPQCVLALQDGPEPMLVPALAGDADMPWSCEDEPALTLADVDGDGRAELIALYPHAAPSGERFQLPLVLRRTAGTPPAALDDARTRRLRESGRLPTTLAEAVRLLREDRSR